MRKISLALLGLLLLCSGAHAQSSKISINSQIDAFFPDNTVGAITPSKLRTVTKNIVASYVDWLTCTGTGQMVYWTSGTPTCLSAGTNGQSIVQAGGLPTWANIDLVNVVGTVTAAQFPALTGDVTTPGGSLATTLASVISAGGPTGSATTVPIITWDAKGRLTAVSSIAVGLDAAQTTAALDTLTSCATQGGILYRNASTWVCLGPGTSGQVLSTLGPGANPAWVPASGGGTVTSVGYAAGAGLALTGTTSPITSSGSFTFALDTIAADRVLMNATGGTAVPTGVAVGSCSTAASALTYNTATHAFGCNSLGSVTSVSVTAGTGITQSGSPVTSSGAITVNVDKATAANYYAAASNKVPTTDVIYPSEVTITYGSTTTVDFDTLINGAVTLTGNITTLTLTNARAGKAGQIRLIQDATGSRTWPAGGNTILKYAGGALPALSTAANAVDVLAYNCSSATFCVASLLKDVRNP